MFRFISARLATGDNLFDSIRSLRLLSAPSRQVNNMTSECYATVSYVTTPNEDVALNLSRKLVELRLAACVNMVKNVQSVYEWQGKIQQDDELLLIIKSNSQKSKDLTEFVQANHPYDCPEVVTLKVDSGSKHYLEWVHETVSKEPPKPIQ